VDDFVKPGVLGIFRVARSYLQSTRKKALTSPVEMRPGLIERSTGCLPHGLQTTSKTMLDGRTQKLWCDLVFAAVVPFTA
jgi:hypothetical protein